MTLSAFRTNLFAGQTAIVTGGATGIGFAIARELLGLGCRVVIASRNKQSLLKAEAALGSHPSASHSAVSHHVCNIRDEDQVRGLMEHVASTCGGLDLLVCNAGGQFPSSANDITTKGWNAVIETNLTGTFMCCREAFKAGLAASENGAVVNIIADMFRGFPGMAHTGAARSYSFRCGQLDEDTRSRMGSQRCTCQCCGARCHLLGERSE